MCTSVLKCIIFHCICMHIYHFVGNIHTALTGTGTLMRADILVGLDSSIWICNRHTPALETSITLTCCTKHTHLMHWTDTFAALNTPAPEASITLTSCTKQTHTCCTEQTHTCCTEQTHTCCTKNTSALEASITLTSCSKQTHTCCTEHAPAALKTHLLLRYPSLSPAALNRHTPATLNRHTPAALKTHLLLRHPLISPPALTDAHLLN